jgi:hypothetical protein
MTQSITLPPDDKYDIIHVVILAMLIMALLNYLFGS